MAAVLYLAAAHLRAAPGATTTWLALLLGPLVLLVGWRATAAPSHGVDRIVAAARSAARLTVAGCSIVVVAELGPRTATFMVALVFGAALASVGSLLALVRVSSLGGIAARAVRSRYDAALLSALVWGAALAVAVGSPLGWAQFSDRLAVEYAVVAAALGSLGITMVLSFRLFAQRRFELGVAERAAAALWLTVLCLALGVFAVLLGVADAERVVPETAVVAAVSVAASSVWQEPSRISRVLRTAVALTMLCAPLVSVSVVVSYKSPTHAGLISFAGTILAACMGLLSPILARRLAPERGLWIRVLERSIEAAKEADPERATTLVLTAIRDGLGREVEPAALYRLISGDRVVVDRAGYLHIEPSVVPPALLDIASTEPERVLSTEALRYIQIERPDVRPVLAWLDGRGAAAASLVMDEEVCVGVLLWPTAGRVSPLSFEEVTLLRRLADHLGSATGALAQLARSRAREIDAENAMARAESRVAALELRLASEALRQRALLEQLARPLSAARYSGAMQAALVEVERLAARGDPMALVAPAGVDVLAWACHVHLASARRDGALVVVDATNSQEQPLARWSDADASPLDMARGGTLLLLDAHALDLDTQRYLARAHPKDVGLVVVLPSTLGELERNGRLDPHLADLVAPREVKLPGLAQRPDDLRALALYELVRIGYTLRGKPMGLSVRAQALLNERDWPGNDAELRAVLIRAAARTEGDVIDAEDLLAAAGNGALSRSGPHPKPGRQMQ